MKKDTWCTLECRLKVNEPIEDSDIDNLKIVENIGKALGIEKSAKHEQAIMIVDAIYLKEDS